MKQGPSHLSSIGYSVISDEDSFNKICADILDRGKKYPINSNNGGHYYELSMPEGPVLWLGTNGKGEFESFTPYFASSHVSEIVLVEILQDPALPFSGVFVGHFDINENRAIPFIFETPHFLLDLNLECPILTKVALSAFAEGIEISETLEDFEDRQNEEASFAPESFVPTGHLHLQEGTSNIPEAKAYFNGVIQKAKILNNSFTGEEFYCLTVKVLDLLIDVVVDFELLQALPDPGAIATVEAWLVAQFK